MFTFYISYTCVEYGKDVMSYFASSSSYSNTFLVSAFTFFKNHQALLHQYCTTKCLSGDHFIIFRLLIPVFFFIYLLQKG